MARSPLVAFRISEDLRTALDAKVAKSGKSQSEILTIALAKYLDQPKGKLTRGRPKIAPNE